MAAASGFDPTSLRAVPPLAADRRMKTLTVGHRGAAGLAPENTVAACMAGIASGVDYLEVDVQLSADGVVFVFHDDHGRRTTNITEIFPDLAGTPLSDMRWEHIQRLDAGNNFVPATSNPLAQVEFFGEKVPSLSQVAELAVGAGVGLFIEVKAPERNLGIEYALTELIATDPSLNALAATGALRILGFNPVSNQFLAELLSDGRHDSHTHQVHIEQLVDHVPDLEMLHRISDYAGSVGVNHHGLDAAGARRVREAGLSLGVWTVNEPAEIARISDLQVDSITGDFPHRLIHPVADQVPQNVTGR